MAEPQVGSLNWYRRQLGLRAAPIQHNPTPFAFVPNNMNFWEYELSELIRQTNSLIFQDVATGDYQIRGEGVRLRMPRRWLVTLSSDELVQQIIHGIEVSVQNRKILGY